MPARTRTKYESDGGDIHPISLTAAYAAAAGTAPTGAIDNDIQVKVTKTNREFGLRPRGVRLYRVLGTAPNTFVRYTFLPVLTETAWSGNGFAPETAITINSIEWKVLKRVSEDL